MSKRQKLLQRIQRSPKNVSFDDLRKLLELYGFELKRSKGSHHSFVGYVSTKKATIVIPYRYPLQTVYVKKALALIEQIESQAVEGGETDDTYDDE
jgi:predicted RNA binding protein YcfA (HicA-like mRNA interferase family)